MSFIGIFHILTLAKPKLFCYNNIADKVVKIIVFVIKLNYFTIQNKITKGVNIIC